MGRRICEEFAGVAFLVFLLVGQAHCYPEEWLPRIAQGSLLVTSIPADFLQYEPENLPVVANGFVGTLVESNTTYISGVYNGINSVTPSHRARIPGTLSITVENSTPTVAALDLERAEFIILGEIAGLEVEQRMYAHRLYRNLMVHEITLRPTSTTPCFQQNQGPITLQLSLNSGLQSADINFQLQDTGTNPASNASYPLNYSVYSGVTILPETKDSTPIAVTYCTTDVPKSLEISCGETAYFMTVFTTSLEEQYTPMLAEEIYSAFASDATSLGTSHRESWRALWDSGRIEIIGNGLLAGKVNASLYELYSNVRHDWSYGMSPGGVSSNAYNGHVFWDQETWMLPNFLLLNQSIAESLLRYRISRLSQAEEKAVHHGFSGAMFPWESALTGVECCPFDKGSNPEGFLEVHINGDISFAAMQYFRASGDLEWLASSAPLFSKVADFWVSKASWNQSLGVYDILNVQPPDESARRVNNSAYTNAVAVKSAEFAVFVDSLLVGNFSKDWQSLASNTPLPFDESMQYHPEYDGYNGETINQADVALMQYPLGMTFPGNISANDLAYYQSVTSKNGYFTGDNAYSIAWLALGNWNAAVRQYLGSFLHIHGPFNVWWEKIEGGHSHFLTGAGGFLQNYIYGFAGMRVNDEYLLINPWPIPNTTGYRLVSIDYRGASFTVEFNGASNLLTLSDLRSTTEAYVFCVTDSAGEMTFWTSDASIVLYPTQWPIYVSRCHEP